MKRQVELQKEMAQQKKEAAERRQQEKRAEGRSGGRSSRSRVQSAEVQEQAGGLNFRSDSPPIPTIRNRSPEKTVQVLDDG